MNYRWVGKSRPIDVWLEQYGSGFRVIADVFQLIIQRDSHWPMAVTAFCDYFGSKVLLE